MTIDRMRCNASPGAIARAHGSCWVLVAWLIAAALPGGLRAQESSAAMRRAPGDEAVAPVVEPAARPTVDAIVDLSTDYVVGRGDSLTSIGARFGVSVRLVAAENGLDARKPLRDGQTLHVTARHIVPRAIDDGILINVPQRMVFLMRDGLPVHAYPAAVGRRDWGTPLGEFTIVNRQVDKTWYVPLSIQEEMRREGKPVLTRVAPGPDNPLGPRWIGLSMPAIGIHGTNAPASIYGFRSHGCIRLNSADVVQLFDAVRVGESGRIVYQPLLLARDGAGRIWFEANPDIYRRGAGSLGTVRTMARERGFAEESIDWRLVETMLRERAGLAREVGVDRDTGSGHGKGERE